MNNIKQLQRKRLADLKRSYRNLQRVKRTPILENPECRDEGRFYTAVILAVMIFVVALVALAIHGLIF